jgi:hypothetical protein
MMGGAPKTWVRPHDRRGARSLVVPNPRACPCCEAVHHARQPKPRIATLLITPPTVVATAVSLVVAHGGDQLDAALVCHVPGRHPFPHSTPLPVPCAQGVGRSSMSHRPRLVTDLSRARSGSRRRWAMHLRAFCDAYHGRERLKARLRVTDSFALI